MDESSSTNWMDLPLHSGSSVDGFLSEAGVENLLSTPLKHEDFGSPVGETLCDKKNKAEENFLSVFRASRELSWHDHLLPSHALLKKTCETCGFDARLEGIVQCWKCTRMWHSSCHFPPIERVASENWLCPSCTSSDSVTPTVSGDVSSWEAKEKHVFFSCMRKELGLSSSEKFGHKQFKYISERVRSKSPADVKNYFYRALNQVRELLWCAGCRMDTENGDDCRVALWCKYNICLSFMKKGQSEIRLDDPSTHSMFVQQLHTSYIKRREKLRSMRRNQRAICMSPTKSRDAVEVSVSGSKTLGVGPLTRDLNQEVFHFPIVRAKRKRNSLCGHNGTDIIKEQLPSPSIPIEILGEVSAPFGRVVDSGNKGSSQTNAKESVVKSPRTERKKINLRVRLVPIDAATRNLALKQGLVPKVEMMLKGSTKISFVCKHLQEKWKVIFKEDPFIQILCVSPVGDKVHPGWGCYDTEISCLDIAQEVGTIRGKNGGMTLQYRWKQTNKRFDVNNRRHERFSISDSESSSCREKSLQIQKPTGYRSGFDLSELLGDDLQSPVSEQVSSPKDSVARNYSVTKQVFNLDCQSTPPTAILSPSELRNKRKLRRITPTLVSSTQVGGQNSFTRVSKRKLL